jgi:hypothetical protein
MKTYKVDDFAGGEHSAKRAYKKGKYIAPCPNSGHCRRLMYLANGIPWSDNYPTYGKHFALKFIDGAAYLASFKCCTQCNKPLNVKEAASLNAWLGNDFESDVVFDNDFLEALNGIPIDEGEAD